MTDHEDGISNLPEYRINNLPDDIVCHILSFLTTEEAALTSVLSKRWRNLFAFAPNLYFDDLDHRKPNNNYTVFRNFVDRVLAVSDNSPVKKFTLFHRQKLDAARVNRWICNALNRGVLDLDLFLILKNSYSLPLEIFSCKTIVRLKLGSLFGIAMVPGNASLPALKTLVLGCIQFSGHAFEALLSACHVLKELTIIGNPWDPEHWEKCRTVSCPTLERLIIKCKAFNYAPRNIAFDTPSLAYLDYCDYVAFEYPTVNLNSLVEAKLSLDLGEYNSKSNPTNLIKGLRNVEILNLSSYETSEVFYSFAEAIPVFEKLSRLSIATNSGRCWKLVPLLLKNSPNLETLVIKGPLHYYDDKYGQKSKSVCECLSGYSFLMSCPVKVLEINEYSGSKSDLEQMRHLMEKLPCLELVKVRVCATSTFAFDTADLLRLPRACKINVFVRDDFRITSFPTTFG